MASTLVVEDGTGLANASSYESAANLRTYALARGVTLAPSDGAGDALVDQMAIKAMDYIERYRNAFWGWLFNPTVQRLSFPREGVPDPNYPAGFSGPLNGEENIVWAGESWRVPTTIPFELKDAQSVLAMQVKAGVDLLPTFTSNSYIVREKVGPIETVYSEKIGAFQLPSIPGVDALLACLIKASGPTRSYRV